MEPMVYPLRTFAKKKFHIFQNKWRIIENDISVQKQWSQAFYQNQIRPIERTHYNNMAPRPLHSIDAHLFQIFTCVTRHVIRGFFQICHINLEIM